MSRTSFRFLFIWLEIRITEEAGNPQTIEFSAWIVTLSHLLYSWNSFFHHLHWGHSNVQRYLISGSVPGKGTVLFDSGWLWCNSLSHSALMRICDQVFSLTITSITFHALNTACSYRHRQHPVVTVWSMLPWFCRFWQRVIYVSPHLYSVMKHLLRHHPQYVAQDNQSRHASYILSSMEAWASNMVLSQRMRFTPNLTLHHNTL